MNFASFNKTFQGHQKKKGKKEKPKLPQTRIYLLRPKPSKVPILKEVTSEKCNSVEFYNIFVLTFMGVIAEYTSNHAQK